MVKSDLELRPFEASDQEQCLSLFRAGMMEALVPVLKLELKGYFPFGIILLSIILAIRWSVHDVVIFVGSCVMFSFLVCFLVYKALTDYIKEVSNSDLRDIGKFYKDGSCMFVAVLHGEVVGMAGIQHKDNHKPGQAELARMSVSSAIRKRGIGSKLLYLIIQFCQENQYSNITLMTGADKVAAISLYKKHGFEEIRRKFQVAYLLFFREIHFEKKIEPLEVG